MRRILFLLFCTISFAAIASANDVYIAQNSTGAGNGSDCADPKAVSFFNTPVNWGLSPTQIGPGTTVHLCGTFLGTAGGTMLTILGSGTSGHPITILFEAGALLTAPYWGNSSPGAGAINCASQNYIIIDGQGTGVINSTQNGSGLAYNTDSEGIWATNCSNFTIQNLAFSNLNIRAYSDTSFNGASTAAFQDIGNISNVSFSHNTVVFCRIAAAYSYSGTSSNLNMTNNTLTNVETAFFVGDTASGSVVNGVTISGNQHNGGSWYWDGNANFHHDPLTHVFAVQSSSSAVNGLIISNNQGQGLFTKPNGPNTSFVFLEGRIESPEIFNNVFTSVSADAGFSNGFLGMRGNMGAVTNAQVYNNTFRGNSDINTVGNGNCVRITGGPSTSVVFKNNIFDNCGTAMDIENSLAAGSDYNTYYRFGANAWYVLGSSEFVSFASWQALGFDGHGQNGNDTKLDANFKPQSGSAAINRGVNLAPLGLTPLDYDKAAAPRPSLGRGNWDGGAYEAGGSTASLPNPPSGLTAAVN
jgi:hypothetical protein